MRIHRRIPWCLAIGLCATQLGATCNQNLPPPGVTVTSVQLSGPTTLTVGQPGAAFTVTFALQGNSSQTLLPIVSLVEEPTGTNTGGLFSWENVVVRPASTSATATLHLACVGDSVAGVDGSPSFPHCPSTGGCADRNGPCSCFKQDNVNPNNPDSGLGGTPILGPQAAHVHADVALVPGGPAQASNTLQILCHR